MKQQRIVGKEDEMDSILFSLKVQMKRKHEEGFSLQPPLVTPEVTEENHFCPLLIWGGKEEEGAGDRRRGVRGGEKKTVKKREEWRDGKPEGGPLECPLCLQAETQREEG